MRYKLICCEVFTREVCFSIFQSLNTIDVEFTPKAAHENPKNLKNTIQEMIYKTEDVGHYDAILLGFGLCGNATVGIKSKSIPIIIPRAHDCCTIFLGSKEKFQTYFKDNFSKEWTSVGYMERGDSYLRETDTTKMLGLDNSYEDFVKQYGEENAQYLWETLHPKSEDDELIFINVPEVSSELQIDKLKVLAKESKKKIRTLKGDMQIIKNLIDGNWEKDKFLVVPPNTEIKSAYDYDKVITL